jgi:MFS family permease
VLLAGIVLGLVTGLAAGGRLDNLLAVRLRWTVLIFVALAIRLGTEAALARDVALADQLRLPLLGAAYGILMAALWVNRAQPGIGLALVGTALNATAILVNGGAMPVWDQALEAAGLAPEDILSPIHFLLSSQPPLEFLLNMGPLGDVIPVPLPVVRNVLSVGDILLASGLAFFVFAALLRGPAPGTVEAVRGRRGRLPGAELPTGERAPADGRAAATAPGVVVAVRAPAPADASIEGPVEAGTDPTGTLRVRPATGLASGLTPTIALERPVVLGGSGAGIAAPAPTSAPGAPGGLRAARRGVVARALGHPYVRLAQNGSFSALWVGQLVSLFGDRLHQLALVALVGEATGNGAFAVAMVFVAATIPNLVFGPLAGALVDRWDQKQVMILSDIARAAIVLLIPAAATVNVLFVYPLVFVLTTVSIFFRPARTAVVPRIVKDDELVAANSAIWLGDSLADVLGYPLAAVFVTFVGTSLAVAFWVDAVTYLASAALIVTMIVPAVVRTAAAAVPGLRGLRDDLVAGWRFLRGEPVLLHNTIQAVVAQFSIGITIGIMAIYASDALTSSAVDERARYGFIEMAIGIGNLIGGFVVGLVGARVAKGRLVIVGYVVYGACVAALALTGNLGVALALTLGMGVANMVFVIPTQALFMERTPNEMMGRVISFRFSAVFGSMTVAMAVGGLMSDLVGAGPVFAVFGALTVVAGLAGLLSRPLREA